MIEVVTGNLLDAPVEALVNTVNTVGVMGKGLALEFRQRFPTNFRAYAAACRQGEVQVGRMFVMEMQSTRQLFAPGGEGAAEPRYIINFPTKQHWRDPSRLEYVRNGLVALAEEIHSRQLRSIAIPPLGCGNGGLDWKDVRPLIERALQPFPEVRVLLFAPAEERAAPQRNEARLTRERALLLQLIEAYSSIDDSMTKIEVQKVAYFLQVAGEDLGLQYQKQQFGPYADELRHHLNAMDGIFLNGVNPTSPRAEIKLRPGALEAATQYLSDHAVSLEHIQRVRRLIIGYETPYSMELLATIHWVALHEGASSFEKALERIQQWNERKMKRYQPRHVEKAWTRLASEGWIQEPLASA